MSIEIHTPETTLQVTMRLVKINGREYLIVPPEKFQLKAPSMKEWRKRDKDVRKMMERLKD